jgi:hypothetical protein
MDWCYSPTLVVELDKGAAAQIECGWAIWFFQTARTSSDPENCLTVEWINRPPGTSPNYLPKGFAVVITADGLACEHPRRKRETIQWHDIQRIWFVTTSDGPCIPRQTPGVVIPSEITLDDHWLVFEGLTGECSVPTEARGFDALVKEIELRLPTFDFMPIMKGGTNEAKYLCWDLLNTGLRNVERG